MIKLNDSRCEQIVNLDGIQTLMNLSKLEIYNNLIIPIICELISSTSTVRDALKKYDSIGLIYYTSKITDNINFYHDIISFVLYWLINDKEYIENFLIQENIFFEFFNNLFLKLNARLLDHLTLILEFFEASNLITNIFFQNNILVSQVVDNIIKNDLTFDNMLLAIETVIKGEKYYSESVIKFLNQQQKEKIYVDVIDRQILHFLNKGIPSTDVALYIPISSSSVKTRIENMKELIGKTDYTDQELVDEAKENGMMLK